MKQKLCCILIAFILLLSGCDDDYISYETKDVIVTVEEASMSPGVLVPMRAGRAIIFMRTGDTYHVTVEYDDIEYSLSSYRYYKKCKDKVNEKIPATITTYYYENGRTKYEIELR